MKSQTLPRYHTQGKFQNFQQFQVVSVYVIKFKLANIKMSKFASFHCIQNRVLNEFSFELAYPVFE